MSVLIIGIDPGAVATGFALVSAERNQRPTLIRSGTVLRAKPTPPAPNQLLPVPQGYLAQIAATCALLSQDALLAAFTHDGTVKPVVIAIEGITRPNWHMHGRAAANPEPLLAAAIVLGNIQAWATSMYGHYTEIPPGGNGSAPLGQYPDTLVSDAERRKSNWQNRIGESGKLRHERSAFDVAHVAARHPINTHTSNRP